MFRRVEERGLFVIAGVGQHEESMDKLIDTYMLWSPDGCGDDDSAAGGADDDEDSEEKHRRSVEKAEREGEKMFDPFDPRLFLLDGSPAELVKIWQKAVLKQVTLGLLAKGEEKADIAKTFASKCLVAFENCPEERAIEQIMLQGYKLWKCISTLGDASRLDDIGGGVQAITTPSPTCPYLSLARDTIKETSYWSDLLSLWTKHTMNSKSLVPKLKKDMSFVDRSWPTDLERVREAIDDIVPRLVSYNSLLRPGSSNQLYEKVLQRVMAFADAALDVAANTPDKTMINSAHRTMLAAGNVFVTNAGFAKKLGDLHSAVEKADLQQRGGGLAKACEDFVADGNLGKKESLDIVRKALSSSAGLTFDPNSGEGVRVVVAIDKLLELLEADPRSPQRGAYEVVESLAQRVQLHKQGEGRVLDTLRWYEALWDFCDEAGKYTGLGDDDESRAKADGNLKGSVSKSIVQKLSVMASVTQKFKGDAGDPKAFMTIMGESQGLVKQIGEQRMMQCEKDAVAAKAKLVELVGGAPVGDPWSLMVGGPEWDDLILHANETVMAIDKKSLTQSMSAADAVPL